MSQIKRDEKPTIKHLRDIPSELDAFGGHEKIAASVKEVIDAPFEGDKKYAKKPIGIVGRWGSGKSTVIRRLRKLYQEASDVYIFEFDAWIYENDPIRRSFLEAFVKFLSQKGVSLTTEEKWEDPLDRIRRQKEKHKVERTPVLTLEGRWFAASLLFFAIGLRLAGHDNFHSEGEIYFSSFVTILIASPFLVPIISWLLRRFSNDEKIRKRDMLSVFVNKTTDTVINEVTKTPDPTAIEFQKLFSDILADIGKNNKKAKIIIVIDNLDRLPEDKAQAMWSTMRSFFIGRDGNHDHFENVWAVVPIDQGAVYYMYADQGHKDPEKRAKAYIEKTFEIVFNLGPPVLSDWEDFMVSMGQEAFSELVSEDEWRKVALLYDVYLNEKAGEERNRTQREAVTPRKIISLINAIGSTYRLNPEFNILVIAFYCIFQDEIEEHIKNITQDFKYPTATGILGRKDWRQYVAAIYFNTDPDTAMQVLLEDPLANSLRDGDVKKLEEIFSRPGCLTVAEKVVYKYAPIWAPSEPHRLFNSAFALKSLQEKDINPRKSCWKYLRNATAEIEMWQSFEPRTPEGIEALLEQTPENSKERISKNILNSLEKVTSDEVLVDDASSKVWLKSLGVIDKHLGTKSDDILKRFDAPANLEFRVNCFLSFSEDTPLRIVRVLASGAEGQDQKNYERGVSDTIAKRVQNSPDLLPNVSITVKKLLAVISDWDLDLIINSLDASVRNEKNVLVAYQTLNYIFRKGGPNSSAVQTKYTQLHNEGFVPDILHKSVTGSKYDVAALCVLSTMKFNPNLGIQHHRGTSNEGMAYYNQFLQEPEKEGYKQLLEHVLKYVRSMFTAPELLELAQAHPNHQKLVSKILMHFLEEEGADIQISSANIINNYDQYIQTLSSEGYKNLVVVVAPKRKDFQEHLNERDNFEPLELHKFLSSLGGDFGKGYAEFALEKLKKLDEDQWFNSISEENQNLQIAVSLRKSGKNVSLPASFREALEKHTIEVYLGSKNPAHLADEWHLLPTLLSPSQENTFFVNLRDRLLTLDFQAGFHRVFELFGTKIFEKGDFKDKAKADEVARTIVMPMISDSKGVTFLNSNSPYIKAILPHSKKDTQEALIEEINSKLQDNYQNDNFGVYEAVAQNLALKKSIKFANEIRKKKEQEQKAKDSTGE